MRKYFPIILFIAALLLGCNKKTPDSSRILVAEVNGNFLYLDNIEQIIPPNTLPVDSADLAEKYIQKWVTDILMYEKAVQNISDASEIDRLVNEYRKTLIIHQYQQKIVNHSRRVQKPTEEEILQFYEYYGKQIFLKENIIKGLLLIVPVDAPDIKKVSKWVKKADQESIENIEKYSLKNAVSYDYFRDRWVPFAEVAKKTNFQSVNPSLFISTNNIVEASDSVHYYFLRIDDYAITGSAEPYDFAKSKIENILTKKKQAEAISILENEIYQNALSRKKLKLYSPKETEN